MENYIWLFALLGVLLVSGELLVKKYDSVLLNMGITCLLISTTFIFKSMHLKNGYIVLGPSDNWLVFFAILSVAILGYMVYRAFFRPTKYIRLKRILNVVNIFTIFTTFGIIAYWAVYFF